MNERKTQFDYLYASALAEVVLPPHGHLETFGDTVINYRIVSELDDEPGRVRVREGRLLAGRPELITPSHLAELHADGFSEEARRYLEYLKDHEDSVRILQYGYRLSREAFTEQVVHGCVAEVLERVVDDVRRSGDPLGAVVRGVDEPWDVALVKLFWETVNASARVNLGEIEAAREREAREKTPAALAEEIERAFAKAQANPDSVAELGGFLRSKGVFERYQDRFFKLVRH